jgi:hypothetical protein
VIVTVHEPAALGVTVKVALGPDALAGVTEASPVQVLVWVSVPVYPASAAAKVVAAPAPVLVKERLEGVSPSVPGAGVGVPPGLDVPPGAELGVGVLPGLPVGAVEGSGPVASEVGGVHAAAANTAVKKQTCNARCGYIVVPL